MGLDFISSGFSNEIMSRTFLIFLCVIWKVGMHSLNLVKVFSYNLKVVVPLFYST